MSCCCHESEPPDSPPVSAEPSPGEWVRFAAGVLLAGLAMSLSLGLNLSPPSGNARFALHGGLLAACAMAFVLLGAPVWRAAVGAIRERRIVADQLFLAGMAGAFGASVLSTWRGEGAIYYEVVIILLAIHAFGRLLTGWQRRGAAHTLEAWRATLEQCLRCEPDGSSRKASVNDIKAGDRIIVTAGEAVPLDGRIEDGRAYVQETAHTGEPFPVACGVGDSVLAGSIVLDGPLVLRASRDGGDREVDRLARAVDVLGGRKSRLEQLTDRAIGIFLPGVLFVSIATFCFWWARDGALTGLFNALSVLLVACPCALGIALPLAQRLGLQRLAVLGVVPRHADAIERLAAVDTIVFDKTGTLTELSLEADELEPLIEDPALRGLIAEAQRHSNHPVARAFWAWRQPLLPGTRLLATSILPGRGVAADFAEGEDRFTLEIGNEMLLTVEDRAVVSPWLLRPGRQLFVRKRGHVAAIVSLRETLRAGAQRLLAALQRAGVEIAILTGDVALPAELRGLKITVATSLSAEQKGAMVRAWQDQGRYVLYLGDGLNDTEVMASAATSLAVRDAHPAALEAADGEWLAETLEALPEALRSATFTRRQLCCILIFAFSYNAVGITLAASGLLHPVAAALLMLASSFTVTSIANVRPARRAKTSSHLSGEPLPAIA